MSNDAAIALAPGVWRIPTAPFDLVNSFAFVDGDGQVTLVDCGLPRAPARVVAGLAAIGRSVHDVTRIVLTHAHADHAGGAARLAQQSGRRIDVHADDAGYLRSGTTPPKDPRTLLGRLLSRLPDSGFTPAAVGQELTDGQLLDVAGGLRVVHTPGHSPGHISLLHEPSRVLITGDAIFNHFSRMRWSIAAFCTDVALSDISAHRLGELEYDVAAFTHGPHLADGAREAVRRLLSVPR